MTSFDPFRDSDYFQYNNPYNGPSANDDFFGFFEPIVNNLMQTGGLSAPTGTQTANNFINSQASGGQSNYGGGGSSSPFGGSAGLEMLIGYEKEYQMQQDALKIRMQDIENRAAAERSQLEIAARERLASQDANLRRELQSGQLNADRYLTQLQLAQSESQFSRQLALETLEANRNYELNKIQTELDKLAEARAERLLQAELAANPADFLKYEHYKRGLGTPQALAATASSQTPLPDFQNQPGQQSGSLSALANQPAQGQAVTPTPGNQNQQYPFYNNVVAYIPDGKGGYMPRIAHPSLDPRQQLANTMQNYPNAVGNPAYGGSGIFPLAQGQPSAAGSPAPTTAGGAAPSTGAAPTGQYPAAPPAYTDEAIQAVLDSIFAGGTIYNPNLSGQGQFGSTIQAPGQISREELNQLSASELAILSSFLQGGIQDPNNPGQQISIDPADYINQVMRSHVPTLSQAGVPTMFK